MTNIAHHTATADTHITKTGPDSFMITEGADQRLTNFIARIGDETQAREGVAESRMTSKELTIARAAFRAGVKAGFIETTEAAAQLARSFKPLAKTAHLVGNEIAYALRKGDHLGGEA